MLEELHVKYYPPAPPPPRLTKEVATGLEMSLNGNHLVNNAIILPTIISPRILSIR
jgi:hypothetical protein